MTVTDETRSIPLRHALRNRLESIDPSVAESWLVDLATAAKETEQETEIAELLGHEDIGGFVGAVMELSPFLRRLIIDDPTRLARLFEAAPDDSAASICDTARSSWRDPETTLSVIRRCRADMALLVAFADLGGIWSVDRAMDVLSSFADAAVETAVNLSLAHEHSLGRIQLKDNDEPQKDSGWILLAVGKLGGRELNYSSDIDLIALFDPESEIVPPDAEPGKIFVRLTQSLIRTLQEQTEDGYVLRTDLRLRPDPRSTAVAVSIPAALQYYESLGQNWERAALIKARAIAGDIGAGESFLDELAPFVWRRYLDYAAIEDIHSIKRQIHEHRGHTEIAIAGHNLKLGRGGIREIEFFVQTQQLIAGGRNLNLRGRRTLEMLSELAGEGWVDQETAEELAEAYRLLRTVEHRLQMVGDEQTHTLPDNATDLLRIARLSGFQTTDQLEAVLRPQLESTQRNYARLFEDAPALAAGIGNLVFTGDEDDPETLKTLASMGFADPALVSGLVRGWHFGRYRATRSATSRERLTEVVPALLEAMAKKSGDRAVVAFDRLLAEMPTGLQFFALLSSNPALLSLLANILGAAPRMAELITRRPHVLDAILEPAFFGGIPDHQILSEHLRQTMDQAESYEEALDRVRIFGQEQMFLIGARILAGTLAARDAAYALTDLADLLAGEALRLASEAIEAAHGHMKGGRVALVAMGKLGGREMTSGSDLDLILLYEFDESTAGSDESRSLSGAQYFARLTQRLVSALSAPTAEGSLYEVDFRLRPSGNSGPLATKIDAFTSYQTKEAWTWEHMALTRARLVAGDQDLIDRATVAIRGILTAKNDPRKLKSDVLEMRKLIEEEKAATGPWDIKLVRGGLMDIEFIAQYLQLRYAVDHPALLEPETERSLTAAKEAGLLSERHATVLLPALRLYQTVIQTIRLCVEEPFTPDDAPEGLRELLARVVGQPDFENVESLLIESEASVLAVFKEALPGPKKRT